MSHSGVYVLCSEQDLRDKQSKDCGSITHTSYIKSSDMISRFRTNKQVNMYLIPTEKVYQTSTEKVLNYHHGKYLVYLHVSVH